MTTGLVAFARLQVEDHIRSLERVFKPGTRLTFLARTPDNDEADLLVTADSLDAIAAAVERAKRREAGARSPVDRFFEGDMECEEHPGVAWPHDNCAGPGMPWTTKAPTEDARTTALREVDALLAEMQREYRERDPGRDSDGNRAANVLGYARARLSTMGSPVLRGHHKDGGRCEDPTCGRAHVPPGAVRA
jgi:hypothetical protein